jgi:hypothetical protein
MPQIVQGRAVAAGFGLRDLGGHILKRGALTTGVERGVHPAKLKRLGRHKSFDVLSEYLEFGDLFEGPAQRLAVTRGRYDSCALSRRCSAASAAAAIRGRSPVAISQIRAGSTWS